MFDKTIHLIAGMPRSGSTLLCNVLAQNPRFHTTATSGILDILVGIRNRFQQLPAFNAMDPDELEAMKLDVLRGVLYSYFKRVEKPVCFDKSRGWERYLEMFQTIIGPEHKVKAIICVRDVREVLASFERLYAKTADTRQIPDEAVNMEMYVKYETVQGRCDHLLQPNGIVGACINRIRDMAQRGWKVGDSVRDDVFICRYEAFTSKPGKTMDALYEFLGYERFKHNFDNVEQVTFEDDIVHMYKDLHKIRSKIEPQKNTWPDRLPESYTKVIDDSVATFWTKLKGMEAE